MIRYFDPNRCKFKETCLDVVLFVSFIFQMYGVLNKKVR